MDWISKKIVILGAARQGLAAAQYLARNGAEVVINDRRSGNEFHTAMERLSEFSTISWVCGEHPLDLLDDADMLCVSGGVPLSLPIVAEAKRRGIPLTNDSQIFLEVAPCKVIGITGSAGKTTTTTIVGLIAGAALDEYQNQSKKHRYPSNSDELSGLSKPVAQVWVGGNIGSPLISVVEDMGPDDMAVMELSSFQLEVTSLSPEIASVLNITPNHLDRHGTMRAYTKVKSRILEYQSSNDIAILGHGDSGAWGLLDKVKGRVFSFGYVENVDYPGTYLNGDDLVYQDHVSKKTIMSRSGVPLRGNHNILNVLAACAISAAVGLSHNAMREGIRSFQGLSHRLEFVRSWGGADWYNDSIATAPERSIAALRSFEDPIVLLAGGRDKDLPWNEFSRLVRQRVDHLILFGEAAGVIKKAVGESYPAILCSNLSEAVQSAAEVVQPGDVVLLSPGGTSFDEFQDFEERGEWFKQLVMQL